MEHVHYSNGIRCDAAMSDGLPPSRDEDGSDDHMRAFSLSLRRSMVPFPILPSFLVVLPCKGAKRGEHFCEMSSRNFCLSHCHGRRYGVDRPWEQSSTERGSKREGESDGDAET